MTVNQETNINISVRQDEDRWILSWNSTDIGIYPTRDECLRDSLNLIQTEISDYYSSRESGAF